jgi:hypothetical protein
MSTDLSLTRDDDRRGARLLRGAAARAVMAARAIGRILRGRPRLGGAPPDQAILGPTRAASPWPPASLAPDHAQRMPHRQIGAHMASRSMSVSARMRASPK